MSLFLIYLLRFSYYWHAADAHDTAPQKLADHFRRVLTDLKEKKWTHYLADKLGDLSKMNPNALKPEHRGFDLDHEPVWLGPRLLYRSVISLFDSIRRLFVITRHQRASARSTPVSGQLLQLEQTFSS